MQADEALALLRRGAAQIISEHELREKLALGRPLRVKLGVDPTAPDIHLGHTVALRKLRQFQDLGHQAVLIIGDFTAMVGDPSGRSTTRPHLSAEEVRANAETYRVQAFKVLDESRTEIAFNGDWFRSMTYEQVIRLNSRVTLQQMLQREDFSDRIEKQHPIHAHEIQYPIMQGWDSVMVKADVELGGTDQLFNVLVGRDFQREEGMPQQVVMLVPMLEGLDGVKKMSKSLGNYVGVDEAPGTMFGKLMSISDELMTKYYQVLLHREIDPAVHPMEAKKQLAFEIVEQFHGRAAAQHSREEWDVRFSEKRLSDSDLPSIPAAQDELANLVVAAYQQAFQVTKSRSEASRLIKQGSVQLDGKKLTDPKARAELTPGQILRLDKTHAVRVG